MPEQKADNSGYRSLHLIILTILIYTSLTILSAVVFFVSDTAPGISGEDKIFTAVSLVTLTSTTFFNPSALTLTGKILSLFIIEISAFTSVFMVYWFSGFYYGSGKKLAGSILKTFAGIQLIFAAGISILWGNKVEFSGLGERLFYSFFHSASAFCNSGFTLFDINFASKEVFQLYVLFIGLSIPMILGNLGLPVIEDLLSIRKLRNRLADPYLDWMSVSKIVFYSTALLILTGAAYLFYSVPDQFIKLRLMEKGISAYFYSTGARSAGFLNIWIPDWENLPKSFISVLMLIGGGPAGTTGGFGILFFALIFRRIFFGNRRTAKNESRLIIGSLTFVLLFLFLITALLLQIDTSWDPLYHPFASKIFDVISAFTNVGWTSHYRWTGFYFNVLLVLSMFIGRIFTIYIGIKTLRYWSDRSSNN